MSRLDTLNIQLFGNHGRWQQYLWNNRKISNLFTKTGFGWNTYRGSMDTRTSSETSRVQVSCFVFVKILKCLQNFNQIIPIHFFFRHDSIVSDRINYDLLKRIQELQNGKFAEQILRSGWYGKFTDCALLRYLFDDSFCPMCCDHPASKWKSQNKNPLLLRTRFGDFKVSWF